jgi:filamentous hemagglutinin family protein
MAGSKQEFWASAAARIARSARTAVALTAGIALGAGTALANPLGGQVVSGGISITVPDPSTLTVQQSTNKGIIDWQSFNIATGEKTVFQQPSSSATTLNRVNVGNPSSIAGQLSANGNLILVNPSGVYFSKGSQVNANSLLVTPANISNRNFLAGKMIFDQPGDPNARVENAGTITVAQSGLAALVAPSVANSGVIRAKLGKVVLGGASTYAIDFYGDGMMSFDVGPNVQTVPLGPDGKPVSSLVSNTGLISAPGGTVLLTADAASGLLANVIDGGGTIAARTATTPTGNVTIGNITIDGGANGALVDGKLNVSGLKPGQTGGNVSVTGNSVALASTAKIDARGHSGGGTVKIGGGPHGTDPTIRNAQTTVVATGATIDASATTSGNGGNVTVWSDNSTAFGGAILAQGGALSGDGGWIETSGHQGLIVADSARINTLAPHGKTGTWLLDPVDLTISSSATDATITVGATTQNNASVNSANIKDTDLTGAGGLATTNVLVTTACKGGTTCNGPLQGTITVDGTANLTWNSGKSLTLMADNNIVISSGATISGTGAGSNLILSAGNTTAAGSITISTPINVNAFTATAGGTGSISLNATPVTTAAGQTYNSPITLGTTATLSDTGNGTIALNGQVTGGTNSLTLSNGSGAQTLSGVTTSGNLTLTTTGTETLLPGAYTITGGADPYVFPAVTIPGNGAYTLGMNTNFGAVTITGSADISNGANNANFTGAIEGFGFLQVTSTGTTTFGGPVGDVQQLNSLRILGTGPIALNGGSAKAASLIVFNGPVTIGADTTVTAGDTISIASVDGAHTLSVISSNGISLGPIGGTTPLTSLTTNATGTTGISSVTTTGAQDYQTAVTIGANTTLASTGSGNITFESTLNDSTAGTDTLAVNTAGTTTFSGAVGGTAALLSLTTDAPGTTAINGGSVKTSGAQDYKDPVTLGAPTTLTTTTSGNVTFESTLDGGQTLSIGAGTGTVTFGGVVGGTPLTSIAVTAAGTTAINGGSVTTTGTQSYVGTTGGITLGAPATLTTTNSLITLGNQVSGTNTALTLSSGAGGATLNGVNIGTASLTLTTTGTVTLDGGAYDIATGAGYTFATAVTTNGTLTLGQATTFNGAVTLGGNSTFDSSAVNKDITFVSTIDGGKTLSVAAGAGTVTFGGVVGATALTSLTVTSAGTTAINGGAVTTTGTQSYVGTTGGITLGADTTLTTTNALITLGNQVTGSGKALNLTDTGGGATVNGLVVGSLTAPTGTFTFKDGTYTVGAGTQTFGPVTVNTTTGTGVALGLPTTFGAMTLAGGDSTITSSGTTIGFGTINDTTAGSQGLTINTGSGKVTFTAAVGTTALKFLTVTDPEIDANITTTAGQTYNNAVTIGGNVTLSSSANGDINFVSTVDDTAAGTHTLTVNTGGNTIFGGQVGATAALVSITTDAGGTTQINGGVGGGVTITTTGLQSYGDNVTLGADAVLASTGAGAITFSGTVDGLHALTVNTSGTTTFSGAVGAANALTSLNTDAGGTTAINGGSVKTSLSQFYGDAVTIGAATTLTSTGVSDINFTSTLNGGFALTVNTGGNTIFGGAVGATTALTSVTTDAPGATQINGGSVKTVNAQVYNDAVTLGANTVLTTGGAAASDSITFGGTLNSANATARNLDLETNATGSVTFSGQIGGTNPLNNLSGSVGAASFSGLAISGTFTLAGNPLTFNTGTYKIGAGGAQSIGALTLNGTITLGQPTNFTGAVTLGSNTIVNETPSTLNAALTFQSTIDGAHTLNIDAGTGKVTFQGVVGGTAALTSLTVTDPEIDANISTTGLQLYNNAVTIGGNVTLSSSASGNITFASTVDDTAAGTHTLTVNTSGNTIFTGAVGGIAALVSLTTDAGGTTQINGNISTTGLQDYKDPVTVSGLLTLASSGSGAITFEQTLDGAATLTVNTSGATTFGGAVGGTTPISGLNTDAGGTTAINGGSVTTTLQQFYQDAVTLGADTTLTSTGSGISFGSTLDGAHILSISTQANSDLIFAGAVGGTAPLKSLSETQAGRTQINGGSVKTVNAQSYNDAVLLGADTTLTTGGAATTDSITFGSTLNSANATARSLDLETNATGTVTFSGQIGGTNPLNNLSGSVGAASFSGLIISGNFTLAANPLTFNTGTYTIGTGGTQSIGALTLNGTITLGQATNFTGAVTLGSNTTVNETPVGLNAAITFQSTIDGSTVGGQSLNIDAGTGKVTFQGVVGGGKALASLTVTDPEIDANITTVGFQLYNDAVTLGGAAGNIIVLTTTNAAVTFASTVDDVSAANAGSQALTVAAGTGTVTFGDAVGATAALNALTVTGGTITFTNTTATVGAKTTGLQLYKASTELDLRGGQTYTTNASIGAGTGTGNGTTATFVANGTGGTVLQGSAGKTVTIDTTGGGNFANGANITFSGAGTIDDATAGNVGLSLNTSAVPVVGAATIAITGNVGGTAALASLTAVAPTITLGNTTTQTSVKTTGAQSYTDTTLNLEGSSYQTNVLPAAGSSTATFTESGATVLNPTGGTSVTIDTTGNGNFASGANISFNGTATIDGTTADTQSLVLNAGTAGTLTLGGAVGNGVELLTFTATAGTFVLTNTGKILTDKTSGSGGTLVLTSVGASSLLNLSTVQLAGETVELSSADGISQNAGDATNIINATGNTAGTGLSVISSGVGSVSLTAKNTVGLLAFQVTGAGNFAFTDAATALKITSVNTTGAGKISGGTTGFGGGTGGKIQLATITSGDITIGNTAAEGLTSNGGEIDVVAAPGFGITNTVATIASGNGKILLLGDSISLSGGTGAVAAGTGTVVLGPSTLADNIVLGEASAAGQLGLQSADFATITTTSGIQVGYRNPDGSSSFSGKICIGDCVVGGAGLTVLTANTPALTLVTGSGTITQTQALTFANGNLDILSGGSVALTNAGNSFADLVGSSGSSFNVFDSAGLTVGATVPAILGVTVNASSGQGSLTAITFGGGAANPPGGVGSGGDILIKTGGNLTLAGNVCAGSCVTVAAANVALVSTGGNINQTGGIVSAAALIVDAPTAGTNTVDLDKNNLVGTLTGQSGGTFQFTDVAASGLTIGSATILGIGPQSNVVTRAGDIRIREQNGNMTLAANVCAGGTACAGVGAKNAALVTTSGSITETGGGIVSAANLIANGATTVTLDNANQVGTLAGQSVGTFRFTNAGALSVGSAPLIVDVGGEAGEANVATTAGDIRIQTNSGNLNLANNVCAGVAGFNCAATANNSAALVASTGSLSEGGGLVEAVNLLLNAATAGQTITFNAANLVGTLAGQSGGGFAFTNAASLIVGTVPVIAGVVGPQSGVVALGDTALTLTGANSNLTLAGVVTASGQTVTLTVGGSIDQTGGAITSGVLTGSSGGTTTLTQNNLIANLDAFSSAGAFSLTNAQSLNLTGALTASGQTVNFAITGALAESGAGAITASTLTGTVSGATTLNGANAIDVLGGFSNTGGAFSLNDTIALTIGDNLNAAGQTVTLTDASSIGENGGVGITAAVVTGSSGTTTTLNGANAIATLADFTSGGDFSLNDGTALSLVGAQSAGTATITLGAGGQIDQASSGVVTAGTLTMSGSGGIALPGQNQVTNLGATTNSGGGGILFNDAVALNVSGVANSGSGVFVLTTAGNLTESGAGSVIAPSLIVSTAGSGALTNVNGVGTLAGNAAGSFGIVNAGSLTIGSIANGSVAGVAFTGKSGFAVGNNLGLVSNSGSLSEAPGAGVSAAGLLLAAAGSATFGSANNVGTLTSRLGGSLTFADAANLTVGTVSGVAGVASQSGIDTNGLGSVTLSVTPANAALTLASNVSVGGQTVSLTSAGSISQSGGIITGGVLTGSSGSTATLTQNNLIANLGAFSSAGAFSLTNAQSLNLTGALTASGQTVNFAITGALAESGAGAITASTLTGTVSGATTLNGANAIGVLGGFSNTGGAFSLNDTIALTIGGNLNAAGQTVTLTDASSIGENGGVGITAAVVTGSSGTTTTLNGANAIATLASFTSGGNFSLADVAALSLVGAQSAGIATITLAAGGQIVQASSGVVTAGTLTMSGNGGIALPGRNQVTNLGATTSGGSGGILFNDAVALNVSGVANSGSGVFVLTTAGNLTESGAGSVIAPSLIVSTAGSGALTNVNGVGTLAGNAAGSFGIVNAGSLTIGSIADGSVAGVAFTGKSGFAVGGNLELVSSSGSLSEAPGVTVSAPGLLLDAAGSVTFVSANNVGTLTSRLGNGGSLNFFDSGNLTVGALVGVAGIDAQSGISAGQEVRLQSAGAVTILSSITADPGGDMFITAGSAMTVTGDITLNATNNIVLASGGAFNQSGTLRIVGPDFVVDTTGQLVAASDVLGSGVFTLGSQISLLGPRQGSKSNNINFGGTLLANSTAVFLLANSGVITGNNVNVGQLGLAGFGSSATLSGSVGGNGSTTAAELGFIFPVEANDYRFNTCAIASTSCVVLPSLTPIQPNPISNFAVVVARPAEDDVDAPLTNIFDENRLCDQLLRSSPEVARMVCQ